MNFVSKNLPLQHFRNDDPHYVFRFWLWQKRTNPGRFIAWVAKCCTMAPNIFGIIVALLFVTYRNVCLVTYTEHKALDNSEVTGHSRTLRLLAFYHPSDA
jgi:hypothetical protein